VFTGSKWILLGGALVFGMASIGGNAYSIYTNGVAAKAEVEKRIAMKDLLGAAIIECGKLNSKPRTESQDDVNAYINDANAWADKTKQLIGDAYGKGEATLFLNDAGIATMASPGHPNVATRSEMIARIQRLNELILRVDTITMRPDFDPNKYAPK
jgi:hypothetical protein